MKTKPKIIALTLIAVLLTTIFVAPTQTQAPVSIASTKKTTKLAAPDFPKVKRYTNTSLQVWWKKVKGAQGYEVFRKDQLTKEYSLLKTLKGNSKTKYIDKNLPENTVQVYQIRAYKTIKKKKQYSGFSYWVSATTYRQGDKLVNAGPVISDWSEAWFAQRDTYDPTRCDYLVCTTNAAFKVGPGKWSKAKHKKPVDSKLRYKSLNTSIITVSEIGAITSKAKIGDGQVRVVAHNGNSKTVTIHVEDCTHPKKLKIPVTNIPDAKNFVKKYQYDLMDIVSYFTKNYVGRKNVYFTLNSKGKVESTPKVKFSKIAPKIQKILKGRPGRSQFHIDDDGVMGIYVLLDKLYGDESSEPPGYFSSYGISYDMNRSEKRDKLAKFWYFDQNTYDTDDFDCYFWDKCDKEGMGYVDESDNSE